MIAINRVISKCVGTIAVPILGVFLFSGYSSAQSSLLEFPTPITSSELSGSIKPRDIGDSRITTYYYAFEGSQGDVFVNLVFKNFAGDIDIFVQSGLKPLTKIVVYPDFGEVETGRVLYLRKPEKLLLRIQGRTPNDDPATFRFKFAGSFVAVSGGTDSPDTPKVSGEANGPVAVNSVGTKIPQAPKPKEIVEDVRAADESKAETTRTELAAAEAKKEPEETKAVEKETPKLEVVVSDDAAKAKAEPPAESVKKAPTPARRTRNTARNTKPPATAAPKSETVETKAEEAANVGEEPKKKEPEKKVDPLANVQLVILFKDGKKIERPLPEVFRFSVDRGVLTVVSKDGRIGKYQMVDVARVTIE